MNTLTSFTGKEFKHILRDPLTLLIMFALPVILMMILSYAVSTEIRNIKVAVFDQSQSTISQRFIAKLCSTEYFKLTGNLSSNSEIEQNFKTNKCDIAIVIPADFGNEILHSGAANLQILLDATNPNNASTITGYVQNTAATFLSLESKNSASAKTGININVKLLYNPQMQSSFNIVPGLQGMLLLLICAMMTSIAVVREKELGTMEILLVSPLKPRVIIFAKAIPYLFVSLIDVVAILLLSKYILNVPINGNLLLIFMLSLIYIFTALAFGLFVSTITKTQQAAMLSVGIGLMMPSMLLPGLIFPIAGMPGILQWISCIIPARWFIEAMRNVMIKGTGLSAIWQQVVILSGMCLFFMILSIKNFRARL